VATGACTSPCWKSREDVGDGDLSNLDTSDDHGEDVARPQDFQRLVTGGTGVGIDLELAVDQVENPAEGIPARP
jgi:hypothetical protein